MLSTAADPRHLVVEYPRPPKPIRPTAPPASVVPAPVLTPKQVQVLTFVNSFRQQHQDHFGPTLQEIADALGVVKSVAAHYARLLLRNGSLRGDYARYGTRLRLREGSLHVAADVLAKLPKDKRNV